MWTLITFFMGVVTGVCLVAAGVWYMLSFFFVDPADKKRDEIANASSTRPKEPTSATFQLPPILMTKITDDSFKSEESCWAVNFVLCFMFRELRNSEGIRRWILRKLSLEFDELLATSVLGKFFSSISIQNVDLGQNFPVLNWLKTTKVELHPVSKNICTLDILVDLDYAGGFQFAIQAETHLKHSAFLSVQFNEVKGQARLQFSTEPYAHWSFSFAENPDIDISVVSQLYGKSFSHITSIIASQLKRSVRKKHTLPMYKIRYKPFFIRVEPIIAALVPDYSPRCDVKGNLALTVIECRGLMSSLLHGNIYSTLAIGDFDWVAASVDKNDEISTVRDLLYVKTARRETSLDFTIALVNDIPIIESLNTAKSATKLRQVLEFEIGDEILAVDGKKVTTIKQCVKNFKNSLSMKVIWRIRRRHENSNKHPSSLEEMEFPSLKTNEAGGAAGPSNEISQELDTPTTATASNTIASADTSTLTPQSLTPSRSRRSSFNLEITAAAEAAFHSQEENLSSGGTGISDESKGRSITYSFKQSDSDQRICHLIRTTHVPCSRDPIFTETCNFNVEESNRFVNLALWSAKSSTQLETTTGSITPATFSPTSSPSKRSKTSAANLESITFGGDRLIGTLSIPLADIVAECSTTGMGYFVKDYYLRSPDGNAADAREIPLTTYSGFEPHMCYGKISLSFLFKSDEEISRRRDSLETSSNQLIPHPIEVATDALSESNLSPSEEFQTHQFIRTHFRTSTICDYCNKKIWLKEAFACGICYMKCHKKCNERCMANTICRGEGFYPMIPSLQNCLQSVGPEIITTGDEGEEFTTIDDNSCDMAATPNTTTKGLQSLETPNTNANGSSRRKTLGGLISAVQNRSAQIHLRRAGSATNLLSPNQNPNSISKSLPPSPKASPTTARKTSMGIIGGLGVEERGNDFDDVVNPFEVLSSCGLVSSKEDINTAVEHLIRNPNDDLVSIAKESGRDLYNELALHERKQKLNHVLNQLQEEIDIISTKRMELSREEMTILDPSARSSISCEIQKYEEKVQALALLMLYYCSGLQQVQDLEELQRVQAHSSSTPTSSTLYSSSGSGVKEPPSNSTGDDDDAEKKIQLGESDPVKPDLVDGKESIIVVDIKNPNDVKQPIDLKGTTIESRESHVHL